MITAGPDRAGWLEEMRIMMNNNWSSRYEGKRDGAVSVNHVAAERVRNLLLILLTVALLGVGIAGGQAIAFRAKCDETMISRMLSECEEALVSARNLARNGSAESSVVLSRIRGNVQSIRALNEVSGQLHNRSDYVVTAASLAELDTVINSYFTKLKNGSVVTEELTNLTALLTTLQETLAEHK